MQKVVALGKGMHVKDLLVVTVLSVWTNRFIYICLMHHFVFISYRWLNLNFNFRALITLPNVWADFTVILP